jgi:DNA-binding CsgD family transcriptional regulator
MASLLGVERLIQRDPSLLWRLLDALPLGIALFTSQGRRVFMNAGLGDLRRHELRVRRLDAAIRLASEEAGRGPATGIGRVTRRVHGTAGTYRVTALVAADASSRPIDLRVVLVETFVEPGLDAKILASTFKLTSREVTVAHRLVAAESSKDIAAGLGVSIHTARRHIENVMKKVGARTRLAAVRRIMEIHV